MGLIINGNEYVTNSQTESSCNIGDIFYTTRLDNELNGAVECNGSQYNFADINGGDNNIQSLLENGKLPYITIDEFDAMVAEQGGCDSFGYGTGTDTIWSQWSKAVNEYVYTKTASYEVGDPVYDVPGGNIIGNITKTGTVYPMTYTDTNGVASYDTLFVDYVNGPVDSTPYFKVPKKLGRVLVRSQKPTADNDYTWYNLYSDGWCEQGGFISATSSSRNVTITLPIEMADNTYNCQKTNLGAADKGEAFGWSWFAFQSSTESNTSTQIIVSVAASSYVNGANWQVSGYANSAEYTKDKWDYQNIKVERPMVQLFNGSTDTALATCTSVLADVSSLKSYDYVVETQEASDSNNYTWYRLYKSGWVEQGKFRNSMGSGVNTTCMLIIPMKDTNYFVTGVYDTNTSAINSLSPIGVGAKTTQSFQMRTEGGMYSWEVKGMSNR